MGSDGASMQFFKYAVFSAPTSFLALLSFRQAVRRACFTAASAAAGVEDGALMEAAGVEGGALVEDAGVCDMAGSANRKRLRHRALAANPRRILIFLECRH
jgi:hypothetical protein